MRVLNAVNEGEIGRCVRGQARERPDALLRNPDACFTSRRSRNQTRVLAERYKPAADVMGARAGLHPDQAARDIGETAFELTTGSIPIA